MAVSNLHYGSRAPTSYHYNELPELYFGNVCCPHHCVYRNLNRTPIDGSSLQLGPSHVDVQENWLHGLTNVSDINLINTSVLNIDFSNAQACMNMSRSANPMSPNPLSPSILPQLESPFNLPNLAVEDDSNNPSFDDLLATTSMPFDLPQDLNMAKVSDGTLGTPSSTTSEDLGFHFCDICFKLLKPSNFRRHMKTHVKPHHCTVEGCSAAFAEKKDLRRHKATKHGIGAATYYCKVVGCEWQFKSFSRLDTLRRHARKVHNVLVETLGPGNCYQHR